MISTEQPTAGFYRMRLIRGGPLVGVRIWYGWPKDPVTKKPLDRSLRWNAEVNGEPVDLERVWPSCEREPIRQSEYHHYRRVHQWARRNDGYDPAATPFRRTNWDDSTPPDFGEAA